MGKTASYCDLPRPLRRRGVQSVCRHILPPFGREGVGFTSFDVAFSLTSQTGLPHFVRQPCPVNNETAMRFVNSKPHTPFRPSPVNDETAMRFVDSELHTSLQPSPVNNETAMRFVDKQRYVLPYVLPSKLENALLCRTTFMFQIAYLWCTTSLIYVC